VRYRHIYYETLIWIIFVLLIRSIISMPYVGPRRYRIDPIYFLSGWHKIHVNQTFIRFNSFV